MSVEGRQAELLVLRTEKGGTTTVNPLVIEGPLHASADIQRFQLRHADGRCEVLVVLRQPREGVADGLRQAIVAALAQKSVPADAIDVRVVDHIADERGPTDKRHRVVPA